MVKFLIQETHNSLHALPVIDKKNICKKKKMSGGTGFKLTGVFSWNWIHYKREKYYSN